MASGWPARHTCGIAPRTCGIAPRTCGIAPRTCGIAPRTCGIAPRTCGIAPRTAGLAQEVLERAKQRKVSWPQPVEEDLERINAAFASIVEFMSRATKECEKYYSYVPASRCHENEIKHICRYHSRHEAENLLQTLEQEATKASKDLYIEVSPGTYSVTATSEDMVKEKHVVNVNAGQSIDLSFSI